MKVLPAVYEISNKGSFGKPFSNQLYFYQSLIFEISLQATEILILQYLFSFFNSSGRVSFKFTK